MERGNRSLKNVEVLLRHRNRAKPPRTVAQISLIAMAVFMAIIAAILVADRPAGPPPRLGDRQAARFLTTLWAPVLGSRFSVLSSRFSVLSDR
jgi:hypothetical protein